MELSRSTGESFLNEAVSNAKRNFEDQKVMKREDGALVLKTLFGAAYDIVGSFGLTSHEVYGQISRGTSIPLNVTQMKNIVITPGLSYEDFDRLVAASILYEELVQRHPELIEEEARRHEEFIALASQKKDHKINVQVRRDYKQLLQRLSRSQS